MWGGLAAEMWGRRVEAGGRVGLRVEAEVRGAKWALEYSHPRRKRRRSFALETPVEAVVAVPARR